MGILALEKSTKTWIIVGVGVLVAIILIIGGSLCLAFTEKRQTDTLAKEYMLVNKCMDSEIDLPCISFVPAPPLYKCDCNFQLGLIKDLKGTITLYYELAKFDQCNKTYASSKDDQQLLGNPGERPAESCGNYSYIDNVPIFPCGEIADSIFNDTFTLDRVMSNDTDEKKPVPVEYTDLVTGETSKYKNPPKEVQNNFTKPKSWVGDPSGVLPWEYNTGLKGVENPAFQAWMDTSLKRKPVWRVQKKGEYADGLPAGNYNMFIKMHYGVNRYNGPRTMILEGVYIETYRKSTAGGVILLLLGFGVLALGVEYLIRERKKNKEEHWRAVRDTHQDDL